MCVCVCVYVCVCVCVFNARPAAKGAISCCVPLENQFLGKRLWENTYFFLFGETGDDFCDDDLAF